MVIYSVSVHFSGAKNFFCINRNTVIVIDKGKIKTYCFLSAIKFHHEFFSPKVFSKQIFLVEKFGVFSCLISAWLLKIF